MTQKNKNRNKGKKGRLVYRIEYDLCLPFCPFCNEPAYDDEYCVFCGAEFIKPTKEELEEVKKANHEYKVIYKNVALIQVGCSVYQYKDNKLISHWSLDKPFTEEELLKEAKKISGEEVENDK